MKYLVLLFTFISAHGFAQVHSTTGSGNFFNPLLWDCFCVPANGDSLVVNHSMQLSASIYYNSGQIKIGPSGSLTEDGTDRDVWVDGTGSLINNGTFDCYRLYVSDGSFINTSSAVYFDSLWNQGSIANSGLITAYDFLNDQAGTFTNSGELFIDNNFYNAGDVLNSSTIVVSNNFTNCNVQTSYAMFVNDGTTCISNDGSNCLDDTLAGSGSYYIGGNFANFGVFNGTFNFNVIGAFAPVGTISPSVTQGSIGCSLSLETQENAISVYPNPVVNLLYVSASDLNYQITDLSGKIVITGITTQDGIDVSGLKTGIYCMKIQNASGEISVVKFSKN